MKFWHIPLLLCVFLGVWLWQQDVQHQAEQGLVSGNTKPAPGLQIGTPPGRAVAYGSETQDWLYPGLVDVFGHFLVLHEQSAEKMWQEFEQYCLPLKDCGAIRDLFQRYVQYKAALVQLDQDVIETASNLSNRLEQQQLQLEKFFSSREIDILFSSELGWEKQAIERLKVARDNTLSPEQKWQWLQQHIQQLPDDQQQAITPSFMLRKAARIEAYFRNANDAYNSYAAEFGPEVAQRLVQRQDESEQWRQRVLLYQKNKRELQLQFQDKQALELAIQQLIADSFSIQEQKRLRVYLSHPELLE